MTQDTGTSSAKLRRLHSNVLKRRRQGANEFLLDDADFRFAADCERMRVDRNGSVLSLLLVRLRNPTQEDIGFFARVLEGRLRVTDTPGMLKDGRVAILLPDTPAEGAWKVAEDVSEIYPPGPGRPECDVLTYPSSGRRRILADQNENGEPLDMEDGQLESEAGLSGSSKQSLPAPTDEFFFAKAHPFWKRSVDIVGGTIGLVLSLPVLVVAALAVKLSSPGPVFFRQEREGYGGKRFTMWKLRSMQVDAEYRKSSLRELSEQDGPAFKMKKDPRTTTVGRFLRWTSMDELPQFWNVLKGDMSLVGPRPLPTEESFSCEGWQRRRLHVMPGMTCTWQVSERGNVSFDEWVRMDLRYAKKQGLLADLRLIFLTIPSLIFQKGMR